MKRYRLLRNVAFLSALCTCLNAAIMASDFDDIPQIRSSILSNSAMMALSAAAVSTNFTLLAVQTNGTLLQLTAQDAYGVGTNATFSYALDDQSKVLRVVCRDNSSNGVDFGYFPGGNVRLYSEYTEGNLNGVHVKLFTNTQVNLFMNTSNNYYVGEGYEFNVSGAIVNATTATVPVSLQYECGPP